MLESLIGAGIGALGNIAGGMISSAGQQSANAANMAFAADQARLNREWQQNMSSTAYRRGMADMKAAGLNPILAYSQGGASTPSGATGSTHVENALEGLGQGVSSAGQLARRAADLENVRTQTSTTASQGKLNEASAALNAANTIKSAQDTATSAADMRRADAETALVMEQMKNPQALRDLHAAQAGMATAQAGTAKSQTDLNRRELADRERAGDSALGRNATSFERILRTIYNGLGNAKKPEGHSAKSSPDPSGIIPGWLLGR